jgi:putative membrane-bound dehydrogenase-like protein
MSTRLSLLALPFLIACLGVTSAQDQKPLRIFIRAGKKTHGPGEHDHPQFLADWTQLLRSRGAKVDGALEFPTEAQLAATDVLVMYAAEAGTIPEDQRAYLDAFLKRGGGLAVLHDAVCGTDPQWFKTVAGGAWEHTKSKFMHGNIGLYFIDHDHPITKGVGNFFFDDEIYWDLHMMPEARVLGVGFHTEKLVTPQLWTYEKDNYRAFVSIQGHKHASFSLPHYRALLLRGIAWAGKRDVDTLVTKEELASLRYPPGGPVDPAKAHEPLVLHPDFDISLVAAEPDVVKPISIDWDPKGRLWAALTPMYPEKANIWQRRPFDRLVYLENGKWKTFYDELDLVTSLAFHKDGVIVTAAPDILFIRDTDGDGKADKRETILTGFGTGDTHAVISNLRWGMDGWLYVTQGYSGGASRNITNAAGKNFGHMGNGIFRFRPDGSACEMISSYGSNTWGQDFRWDGEHFFTMANESHLRHVVMPESALARGKIGKTESWKQINDHRDSAPLLRYDVIPYKQIDCVGGFTAAAGSQLYQGGAWPDAWNGVHFVTECTINLVHADVLSPDGATFKGSKQRAEEFLAARDLWFRPVDTRVGPDGALYVCDFYNQAVVHNDTRGPRHGPYNAAVRPDRDHMHGRIWRVQHRQAKALPAFAFGSTADLVKALEHPNRWVRMTAHRLLMEKGEGAAEALKSPLAWARVHALWLQQLAGKLSPDQLAAALADGEAGVRKNAARIAGQQKAEAPPKALLAAAGDADARTRLEAILALVAYPVTADVAAALSKLYPTLEDNWTRSAVLGVAASAPAMFLAEASLAGDLADAVGARQNGDLAAQLVIKAATLESNAAKAAVLGRLFKTLKPDVVPPPSPELQKALESLLASGDAAVTSAALPFVSRWDRDGALAKSLEPFALKLLEQVKTSKSDAGRSEGLATLLAIPAVRARAIEAAAALLEPSSSSDLHRSVIEALGTTADPAVGPVLVAALPRLTAAPRDLALGQILKRVEWTGSLISEIEKKNFNPVLLGPAGIFRLKNHPNAGVAQKAAAAIEAVTGAENKAKDQIIAQLLPVITKKGDAVKGKALFVENCLKCHSYKGEGKNVGPDLTGMGAHGAAELIVHIVDPNRAVEPNYISFNVRVKSGDIFNGLVVRETREMVVLRNNEGDREIRKPDIEVMVSTGLSLMPTGLEALGAEPIRDILTFLTADAGGFRVVDLQTAATASTKKGLYDPQREPNNFRPKKHGIHVVEGVPFNMMDPEKSITGNNAIVLKGGSAPEWNCKVNLPRKVDVNLGFALEKLHVLGGIAAWGTLDPDRKPVPACKVTWHYADGQSEEKVLYDAREFSDWIRRVDVPGSKFVPDFLEKGAPGQVRYFSIAPGRKAVVHHVTLESYDNYLAPTFIALTAELGGAHAAVEAPPQAASSKILIVGGGSSHDFGKWWKGTDAATLGAAYTENVGDVLPALEKLEVLYLGNNQEMKDPAFRKGIFDFVGKGRGLLLVHASTWYNWKDWPEYNKSLVGGGSRGHEAYQEFEVTVNDQTHPLMMGVAKTFRVKDELYRFEKDAEGAEIQVLATGKSLKTEKEYPVVWIVKGQKGRIVCNTLGHDGVAHQDDNFKALLRNAAAWLGPK